MRNEMNLTSRVTMPNLTVISDMMKCRYCNAFHVLDHDSCVQVRCPMSFYT